MTDRSPLSRALLRRAENVELSLGSLEAISEIRAHLNELEGLSMASAREKGATVEDIADALKLTPQAIYYRFRQGKVNLQTAPGRPNTPEPPLVQEPVLAPHDRSDPAEDSILGHDPRLGA